jgi:hypothetical protein
MPQNALEGTKSSSPPLGRPNQACSLPLWPPLQLLSPLPSPLLSVPLPSLAFHG